MGRFRRMLKRMHFHFSRGIVCHGRCIKNISKEAKVEIHDKLDFNERFSKNDGAHYEVGRISLAKQSTLIVHERIAFFAGCKLSVSSNATLEIMGGGL